MISLKWKRKIDKAEICEVHGNFIETCMKEGDCDDMTERGFMELYCKDCYAYKPGIVRRGGRDL